MRRTPKAGWLTMLLGWALLVLAQTSAGAPGSAGSAVIRVGPKEAVRTIAEAAQLARDGDVVEVQAGEYVRDVAVWTQSRLTIRAVGGRARLRPLGQAAEGKAIWVIRGGDITVQGFDFEEARVVSRNGAGIRLEKGRLTVEDCRFVGNEMGLLTANDPAIELIVRRSEFAHNRRSDGHNHNLYVGAIGRFEITASYLHHAYLGHLLKSRAAINHVLYNRLSDESGGMASYELEFPNGGVAVVIGNIIQQSAQTENEVMIAYGAEGYRWPRNALYLSYNTLVDNLPQRGRFLKVFPGADVTVHAVNNLLVGQQSFSGAESGIFRNNFPVDWDQFVRAAREDYRLRATAGVAGKAVDAGVVDGVPLRPDHEYVHPLQALPLQAPPRHPGALQQQPAAR
jgi:hypothetical protein